MAAAEMKFRRGSISEIFREFKLADLRVLLLGNSWTERALVGNLLVDSRVFNEEAEPQSSVKHSVQQKDMTITVINTTDMLHPDWTDAQLSDLVFEAAQASDPGPHVFLLVLQPENFTEQHHRWLQAVLNKFSEQSFHHAFVLLSKGQMELLERPHLQSLITKCRFRYQWIKHSDDETVNGFTRKELFTRLAQMVKENSEEHLKYESFEDTDSPASSHRPNAVSRMKGNFTGIFESVKKIGLKADPSKSSKSHQKACHSRVLLVGRSDEKKKTLQNYIISPKPHHQSSSKVDIGEWKGKFLKVVRSADVFSMNVPEVISEMKRCVSECCPGPNVLLLLVKPSELTEAHRQTLNFILTLFGPDAFKYAIAIFTHDEKSDCASQLLSDCEGRCYEMFHENHSQLMDIMEAVVDENHGRFVTLTNPFTIEKKKHLNLVFCGRKGSRKTSVAQAILDDDAVCYESRSSECTVRHGTVSGRPVSIVELPALSRKTQKEVMEDCLRCISMYGPDGVHTFVMVLPLKALTDEDKAEFKTIQSTFSSRINNSTVILFTVESDPNSKAVTDFVALHEDIQTLCKSCRGHIIFNINDKTQAPRVVEELEKSKNWFTTEMFAEIQIERFTQMTSSETPGRNTEKTLRIVLIGKTGRGKSSSGNTILGRDVFKCDFGQKATTKSCQKERSKLRSCYIDVVDTPGLFDMRLSNHDINEEMMKCISLLAPGPHVFLLVLGIGRFTPEENETLNLIKKGFGKEAQKYTIVLFTHGDVLEQNKTSIEDFIKDKCDSLCQKLISDCGNRHHVFNNCDKSKKQVQVEELIKKIEALVEENGGSCYTNEMLKEAEAAIQEEVQKLLREKDEELRRKMEEMKDKHEREIQEIKTKMEKEREKTEQEREEKDRELKEMKAQIRKDQEKSKMDQKKKEEEYKKERQEYEQNIHSFDLKTQEAKEKILQERKAWEEEMRKCEKRYEEEQKRWQEEQFRLEKQEEEYKQKLQTWTREREKDEQRREQELQELKEQHNQQITDLKRNFDDNLREQAEQFNEFIKKKDIDFAARIDEHLEEVKRLKDNIKQKEGEYKSLENLKAESETSLKNKMENLQTMHKEQLIDLAIVALMNEKENHKKIKEVQKKHKQEIKTCEKDISDQFENERKTKVEALKKKQNQEIKHLEENAEDFPQKKKELSQNHKQQLEHLESELWSEHKQELKREVDKIKKKHEEEMNKITKSLLKKNKEYWTKQTSDLEIKQKQEMDTFMKKAGGKVNEVELDRLRTKHQVEMDQIKKRMFLEEGWCSVL